MSQYLKFVPVEEQTRGRKRRTAYYHVKNKETDAKLGEVFFYPQWRQFVFVPKNEPDCFIFLSEGCLQDIASFCDAETQEWRRQLLKQRAEVRYVDPARNQL